MQLELIFTNDARCLSSARAFVAETLRQFPLDAAVAQQLDACAIAAATHAIENAYPAGEEGKIELTIREEHGKLEFLVRDHGLPLDAATLEQRFHDPSICAAEKIALHWPGADAVDEFHWLGFGRDGKAIQLVKWLHDDHIAERADAASLKPFTDDVPIAPQQEYTIRRMLPDEAVQVSQLIYRAYGNSYINEDVYFPERVAALNASNTNISFVAVGADGRLAGHYALERDEPGPIAECGQAVVDPAHRGRGLLDRMKDAALEEARRLELVGVFADAVTAHTRTQQSDIKHGAHLTCIDLAVAPRSMSFKGISNELPQRLSCAMFFQWLSTPEPRTVFAPERHLAMIQAIYKNLACPFTFGKPATPTGHGTLTVKVSSGAATAYLRADQLGADTAQLIRHAKREVLERSHVEAVYAELPLADPATPQIAAELESDGFGFLGVAPHFTPRGDLLRLAYIVDSLDCDPIKTADAFTGQLVEYALAEQKRVQAAM